MQSLLIENTFRYIRMRVGFILLLIWVLFASSRTYIHHTSTLIWLNAIKVTWNEFWYYNMRKVSQNSLKKHVRSHSNAFKLQSTATLVVIGILTHLYSWEKYVNVLYKHFKSSEIIFWQLEVRRRSHNWLKTHLESFEYV